MAVSVPVPSTLVRLKRDDGTWAGIDEPGELCVQGPQVMKGYWNCLEDTAKAIDRDGWFATGDIGVMDARGFIRLIDRNNEIEDVLAVHPKMHAVAAVVMPNMASLLLNSPNLNL